MQGTLLTKRKIVKRYWADLRMITMGTITINKAIVNDISRTINISEPVISFHANIRDKKISTSRVYPMFIIDFNIVSELIDFLSS